MAATENQMTAVELARRLAELGQGEQALRAYGIALTLKESSAEDRLEAACAILQYGEDYKVAYDALVDLYNDSHLREDVLNILNEAFYLPNAAQQKKQYVKNCKLLKKYPYLFRKDFLSFDELPLKFYPYDDNGVLPFSVSGERFDPYIDFNEPMIRHYFFRDLDNPVLAHDIFSQYELEYLNDNVRRSDWVAKENHIYLHYTDWGVFCAHLQCFDWKPLLEDHKFVFLIEEEEALYPIDFKDRFGIDYSQYSVKPVGIREINRIIWHTQLHSHNGGDFFNEIMAGHPNVFAEDSRIFAPLIDLLERMRQAAQDISDSRGKIGWNDAMLKNFDHAVLDELASLRHVTLKDALVSYYLGLPSFRQHLDTSARIVPVVFFQPHFHLLQVDWSPINEGGTILTSSAIEAVRQSGLLQGFKYVKTFSPMRRVTTSHAATVRFAWYQVETGQTVSNPNTGKPVMLSDVYGERIANQTYFVDKKDRLFADSRLVRFEDAKLNPTATFRALAEFLDIPYTESMTRCDSAIGFSTDAVYRTYDEFSDPNERKLLEYLLRDTYRHYGYDFHYYDGAPMTDAEVEELADQCYANYELSERSYWMGRELVGKNAALEGEALDSHIKDMMERDFAERKARLSLMIQLFQQNTTFFAPNGNPMEYMERLELDPALMEAELYH